MAMVISGRAKAIIFGMFAFIVLGGVLVTGSTKGWFLGKRYNDVEHVAARIQVIDFSLSLQKSSSFSFFVTTCLSRSHTCTVVLRDDIPVRFLCPPFLLTAATERHEILLKSCFSPSRMYN